MSGTRIYSIWKGIKTRCYNEKHVHYNSYGGRGIVVCNEWKDSFEAFYEWSMANGYSENLTLDRIDVNGNYEPSNCRWSTRKEQLNNKRNNIMITHNGKTQTLSQWANETGINYYKLRRRTIKGWKSEEIFGKK